MSTAVTNQAVSPALRGQDALVTLNQSDSANLANFTIGQKATVGSTSKVGYISEIDTYGHTFRVKPQVPSGRFDSTASGYLSAAETVTVN